MSELPPGSVTTADLYRVLVDMQGTMSKLAAHIERIDGRNLSADQLHADHEARIRVIEGKIPENVSERISTLEKFKYLLLGGAAIAGTAGGWLAEWLASRH